MTVRSHRIVGAAASVAVLAAVVVATFVGVSLVAGGGDQPPPVSPDATPEPPRGFVPTPDPNLPGFSFPTQVPTPKGPESVTISSVVIPIPEGARYSHRAGPEGPLLHQIWFGGSNFRETESGAVAAGVQFDEFGLVHADFEGPQADALVPTLDALWALAQTVGTPSPPSLVVDGVDIPLPDGSYYTTIETQAPGGTDIIIVRYDVRLEHTVLRFDRWEIGLKTSVRVVSNNVKPGDEARFLPTLDAVNMLTTSE